MNKKTFVITISLCVLIAGGIVLGLCLGASAYKVSDVIDILKSNILGIENSEIVKGTNVIVWQMRAPRIILAIVVGGGLAIAGVCMQSLTQNVMADPYILGGSAGASVFVTFAYLLGTSLLSNVLFIPIMAFIGALIALLLVYAIGFSGGGSSKTRIVLTGLAVSTVLTALSRLFISLNSNFQTLRALADWFIGSLAGARWHSVVVPAVFIVISCIYLCFRGNDFNLSTMGDDAAISLGLNVNRFKKKIIIIVSLITGFAVATSGMIGFIGFVIPHIVRIIVGADHRRLLPLSFLTGGGFLLYMDILARTVIAPQELSVGVFTSLFGGPFFVWLIYRKNKLGKI